MSKKKNPPASSDMLGAAGACPVLSANGKQYKLGWPTKAAEARLEQLIAHHEYQRIKKFQGQEVWDDLYQRHLDALERREHSIWVQEVETGKDTKRPSMSTRVIGSADGSLLFGLSLFQEHHPDMTLEECQEVMAEDPYAYKAALELVTPRFFEIVAARLHKDPVQRKKMIDQAMAKMSLPHSAGALRAI